MSLQSPSGSAGASSSVGLTFRRDRSFGKPVGVQFRMIREDGGWRIDDIVNSFEGKAYSVRDELSKPYDCGSFMGKPCKR